MFKKVVSLCLSTAVAMSLGVVAGAEMPKLETFSKEQCEVKCKEIGDLEENLKNKIESYDHKRNGLNIGKKIIEISIKERQQAEDLKLTILKELECHSEDSFYIKLIKLIKKMGLGFDPEFRDCNERIDINTLIIAQQMKNFLEYKSELKTRENDINKMRNKLEKVKENYKSLCASTYPCEENKKEEL